MIVEIDELVKDIQAIRLRQNEHIGKLFNMNLHKKGNSKSDSGSRL